MTVLDRMGAIIGVVKALELAEGVKPPMSLVLGETQNRPKLEACPRAITRTSRPAFEGHLLIETTEGKDIVESLESIHRIADTAVHLAVVLQIDKRATGHLSAHKVLRPHPKADRL